MSDTFSLERWTFGGRFVRSLSALAELPRRLASAPRRSELTVALGVGEPGWCP